MRKHERKNVVYVSEFKYSGSVLDEPGTYGAVCSREALWQVLGMYDVGGKILSGIKSLCVDSSGCVRVKAGESERFRIYSWVRQGCIMSPWVFNVYMDRVMKEVKMGMGRRGVSFLGDGREWRLHGLLYTDDLVLCGESEEHLRVMVGRFAEVCRRRGLKDNSVKSK